MALFLIPKRFTLYFILGEFMVNLYVLDTNIREGFDFQKLYNKLPDYRKAKINKIKFQEDKILSLGAGLLTKHILTINNLNDINIKFINNGKPVVEGLFFNISHSGKYVICAVADKAVGVDIEKISEYNENIPKRFFARKECEYLSAQPEANKNKEFFRIWTIKESYIKMTGEGISCGLDSFWVDFTKDTEIYRNINNTPLKQECYIYEFPFKEYCCSICSEDDKLNSNINYMKFSDFI